MQNDKKIPKHIIVIGGFLVDAKYILIPALNQCNNILIDFIDINTLNIYNNLNDTIDNLVRKIKMLKNFNEKNNIIIIAYSFGGILAIYCHKIIHYCSKLILINTTPQFIENESWQGIKNIEYKKLIEKFEILSLENFINYFIRLASYPYEVDKNLINQIVSMNYNKNILLNLLYLMKNINALNVLNKIEIETIMLYSSYDILVPYNYINNEYIKAITINHSSHLNLNNNILSLIIEHL